LHQRHFLQLLDQSLSRRDLKVAKVLLGAGLLMRLLVGGGQALAGHKAGRFLARSSAQRLADLVGALGR
jgi:hypothetical protein